MSECSASIPESLDEAMCLIEELRLRERKLEIRNAVLGEELDNARVFMSAIDQSRSNSDLEYFASIASHDLQEPLRSMSSCLQLLKKRYEGILDERADEIIAHAVAGSQRMRVLIDDLLALSQVIASSVNLVETDSAVIFEQVRANLATSIEESGALVSQEDLPTVISTPQMLSQLLQNLISNAIKFRDSRPPVVQVKAMRDGDWWVFSVADQGIGIDPEHFEHIFQSFQRLHTTDAYPGTGLGLAICQKIVNQHGGKIWVESTPGIGSTFYFTQPAVSTVETMPNEKSNPYLLKS